jgi:hypothetical protein
MKPITPCCRADSASWPSLERLGLLSRTFATCITEGKMAALLRVQFCTRYTVNSKGVSGGPERQLLPVLAAKDRGFRGGRIQDQAADRARAVVLGVLSTPAARCRYLALKK